MGDSVKISDSPAFAGIRVLKFIDEMNNAKGEKIGIDSLRSNIKYLFRVSKEVREFAKAKGLFGKVREGFDFLPLAKEADEKIIPSLPLMARELADLDNSEIEIIGTDISSYIPSFSKKLTIEEQRVFIITIIVSIDTGYDLYKKIDSLLEK